MLDTPQRRQQVIVTYHCKGLKYKYEVTVIGVLQKCSLHLYLSNQLWTTGIERYYNRDVHPMQQFNQT